MCFIRMWPNDTLYQLGLFWLSKVKFARCYGKGQCHRRCCVKFRDSQYDMNAPMHSI